jgi:uncharacterized protein
MKNIFIVAFLFSILCTANTNPQLISVNGLAERSVDPNMVILNIESYGKAQTAKLAQEDQAKEYNRIKTVIEKFKIKKDDFSTENYSINPEYVYDQKTQNNKITGYRVVHQIKISHHKTDEAGGLIDALTSNAKIDSSGVNIFNQSLGILIKNRPQNHKRWLRLSGQRKKKPKI